MLVEPCLGLLIGALKLFVGQFEEGVGGVLERLGGDDTELLAEDPLGVG